MKKISILYIFVEQNYSLKKHIFKFFCIVFYFYYNVYETPTLLSNIKHIECDTLKIKKIESSKRIRHYKLSITNFLLRKLLISMKYSKKPITYIFVRNQENFYSHIVKKRRKNIMNLRKRFQSFNGTVIYEFNFNA
ncbi:hypothetical protein EDEG_02722 [Edhazardia aedis USNM 41457]|uniref:Uncharacterized protein n=1 Tax=Edhazardia aedis (strain USNM 41457) TaxID=1003232 RepID=J8ZT95_EDHAE|nr:hypothetical protein EDEG_02722 [Edhazardia aedis USNM 41457]|eukprot:EJW02898.1 hypothetical protein EDEG_02722 [Edhazardia aedis USNM 41457]